MFSISANSTEISKNISINILYKIYILDKKITRNYKIKSFKEVTICDFFLKLTQNSPFNTRVEQRRNQEKKHLLRSNSNHRGIQVSFQTKIAYSELERPKSTLSP